MRHFCWKPLFFIALLGLISLACGGAKLYPEPAVATNDVLSLIDAERYKPQYMRITAKVDYVDEAENKRVVGRDFIISAEQPNYLRITLSSFDKTLSTLVTDGEQLLLIDAMQNVFVIGRATAKNLSKLLPLYMSAYDIIRILSGAYPQDGLLDAAEQNNDIKWCPSENGYERRLKLKNGNEQSVFYRYPSGDIFKITIHKNGELHYLFEASNFESLSYDEAHSIRLPKTVVFKMKAEKVDLRLRIEAYDLEPSFSPGVFKLMPPVGYDIILLDDDGDLVEMPKNAPTDLPTDTQTDLPTDTQTDLPTDTQTDLPTDTQTDDSEQAPI